MNEYEVRFVFDRANIMVVIDADNEAEAKRWASYLLAEQGISFAEEPLEIIAEITATYGV